MNNQLRLTGVSILLILATLAGCGDSSTLEAAPPIAAITAQPTDQSVVAGTAATFNVVAANASGYQWQSSTDGGTSFTNLSAATSASHTTAASTLPDSGTKYRVVVAGVGNSVTSSAATLTVTGAVLAPSISVQPAAQTTTAGQNASFSVTASGTTLVGAAVAAGTSPRSVTVDPSGKFAYVANTNSADVSAFTINASTGALTSIGTVAAGTSPWSVITTGTIQ